MKKIIAAAIALILALGVFAGCTLVQDDDGNAVIATVNGKPILKSAYNEVYNYYYYMYTSYYGYDASTAESTLAGYATEFLAGLIQDEVLRQKAEAEGYFNYTDEQRAEAVKVLEEDKKEYIDSFVKTYLDALKGQEIKGKNAGESDEDYFKRIAEQKYLADLEDSGTPYDELLENQLFSMAIEKFKEDKLKDVKVLEADIVAYYDDLYEEQKQELTTDSIFVKAYKGQSITLSTSSTATYDMILYNRAGYSLVQHILINFEEADLEKLKAIVATIAEYDEEIEGRTATIEKETDEALKAEEQKALDAAKTKRAELQEQYDLAIKEATAKIQTKVDEVYASVKDANEEDFIKAIVEKSDDTGMKTEEAAKKGYLVGPEDGMVEEFSEAAKALEAGKISEPVATYHGMHIIRCMKKLAEGKVPYDDVKEEIETKLTDEKKTEEWSKMLTLWESEAKIKKYKSRLD